MSEGCIPTDWKIANVTPIFKKGSKLKPDNYRPVSLTSVICKVMESLIRDDIMQHLSINNLIFSSQHGFMARKSCLTNLLEYLETLTDLIDQGHSVDVIYLDFAKAFDKVPHARLKVTLEAHGISGDILNWITGWLSDRKQRVVLNGERSDWLPVTSGVPQGSVLGPTLFVIFINPIDRLIVRLSAILSKFADDTKVGSIVNNESNSAVLQEIINILSNWADEWQMTFNFTKCKVMHLGRRNPRFNYTMGGHAPAGTVLEVVEQEKDVGVIISSDLKPSAQCNTAVKKSNQLLGRMARSFTYRNKSTWISLYKVYIRPHLEYAVQAWSPWTQKDINLLEDVQRRVIRMTSGLKGGSYEDKLKEVGLQSLENRRLRGDMIQTWKILHNHDDVIESTWFTRVNHIANRTTRLSAGIYNIQLKHANLETRRNFFSLRVTNSWNSLPDSMKEAISLNSFKNLYDSFINAP